MERVCLRAVEPSDVDRLYIWENDRTLWPHGNTRAPLSRFLLSEYASGYDADPFAAGQLRLMIITGEEACGTVDIYEFDPLAGKAGIGIFVAPAYRGRGIGSEALNAMSAYCRDTLNMHQLWCTVLVDNTPSLALFKKEGFSVAGRLRSWVRAGGKYRDVFIMQLMLDSFSD